MDQPISLSELRRAIRTALLSDNDYFPYSVLADGLLGQISVYSTTADRRIPIARYVVSGIDRVSRITLLDGPESDFSYVAASVDLGKALDGSQIPYIDERDAGEGKTSLKDRINWYADRMHYKSREL